MSRFRSGDWVCFVQGTTGKWTTVRDVREGEMGDVYVLVAPGERYALNENFTEAQLAGTKVEAAELMRSALEKRRDTLLKQVEKINLRLAKGVRAPNYPKEMSVEA